jgi:hypothetical protein
MSFERPSAALRQRVAERARGCCEYCFTQRRFSCDPFSIEHVLPRSRGGTSAPGNLALACQGCNNHKHTHLGGVDPVSGADVPLYHPREDIWSDHFAWTEDYTEIVGLTARGRATVLRLQLNRPAVVALRTILAAAHLHPPDYPCSQANP